MIYYIYSKGDVELNENFINNNTPIPQPPNSAENFSGQSAQQQKPNTQNSPPWQMPPSNNGFQQRTAPPIPTPNPPQFSGGSQRGYTQQPQNTWNPNGYPQNPPPQYNYPQRRNYPQQAYAVPNGYYPYYYQPSPKELEKTALAKASSRAGKYTLFLLGGLYLVAFIIEIVAIFCGVANHAPSDTDPYYGFTAMGFYLYEGLGTLIGIFIPALIMLKASKIPFNEALPFKKIEGKKLFFIVMASMAVCMIAQIATVLFGINMSMFGIDIYAGLETATATGVFDIIMGTICTALIPALVEEFAYRGLVFSVLKQQDTMLAVLGSAFLFGMLHGNFVQIPFAFVVGLALGYVRAKTNSMLPGILIHFGNNFFSVIVSIASEALPDTYGTIIESLFMLLFIGIGLVSIYYLTKNYKDFFEIESDTKSLLTFPEKAKIFFSSGTIIASIVILTILAFAVLAIL